MMPPPAYLIARRRAPYHLQVEVPPQSPAGIPGPVLLSASVVKVFRGRGISGGDSVSFPLHVCEKDEQVHPGAARWLSAEHLRGTSYLELFLDRSASGLAVAGSGGCWSKILGPTGSPTVKRPGFFESLLAWRRWRRRSNP